MDTVNGPHVGLAVLCERVDRKDDGSMDVLGIVEGVLLDLPGPSEADPLELRPVAVLPLRLVVSLRAGDLYGRHRVEIVGRFPAGNAGPSTGTDVEFSPQRPIATVNVPLELEVHEAGHKVIDLQHPTIDHGDGTLESPSRIHRH